MPYSGTRQVHRITSQDRERARALIARVDALRVQTDAEHLATIRGEEKNPARFRHYVIGKKARR